MFEFVCIFTTGGAILFSKVLSKIPNILQHVVDMILQVKNPQSQIEIDPWLIRYSLDTILGIVFVIAWRKQYIMTQSQKFLYLLRKQWKKVHAQIENGIVKNIPYFQQNFHKVESQFLQILQQNGNKNNKNPNSRDTSPCSAKSDPTTSYNIKQNIKKLKKKLKKQNSISNKPKKIQLPTNHIKNSTKWNDEQKDGKKIIDYSVKSSNKKKSNYYEDENEVKGFIQSDQETQQSGFFKNLFNKFTLSSEINQQNITPVINQLKQKLLIRNVAEQVARNMLQSVKLTLLKKKVQGFNSVSKAVKQAVKQVVSKILSVKQIDLVKLAFSAKQRGEPLKIVFIGVNGVGKSTNLAKVGYMFKKQGLSIMLAACDNFRAGAVQQLKVHAQALQVPIYQKGYKAQPVTIALGAVKQAKQNRTDVLLIDTAGRMQEKKALMAQLGKLVSSIKPDVVLFIGQALVGNDAIDQLTKFNQALQKESINNQQIDGIILSKFDTIDDKVGAALTMTYITRKPIVYVGVGQKYPHLKKLNVSTVVEALLS